MKYSRLLIILAICIVILSSRSSNAWNQQVNPQKELNRILNLHLHRAFIETYGEQKAKEVAYDELLFSPDGRFIAATISEIESGDPEQVWIIDLKETGVRLVTERLKKNRVGLRIYRTRWESEGILLIDLQRIDWLDQSKNKEITLRATTQTSEALPKSWIGNYYDLEKSEKVFSPRHRYELKESTSGVQELVDLKNQGKIIKKFIHERSTIIKFNWTTDESAYVFLEGFGGLEFELWAGSSSPPFDTLQLCSRDSSTPSFVISPKDPIVAFAVQNSNRQPNQIIFFDLQKRKEVKELAVGQKWNGPMAWSNKDQVIYTGISCELNTLEEQTSEVTPYEHVCILNWY